MDKREVKKSGCRRRGLRAIILILISASLFWLFLPDLIRHTVTTTLTEAGFKEITIGEIHTGLSHLQLHALKVDRITVGQVDIWYDFGSLFAGRATRMLISDVLMKPSDIPASSGRAKSNEIPCDTIEVTNLVCLLPEDEEISAKGRLEAGRFEAHLQTAAGAVEIEGDVQLASMSGNFTFSARAFDLKKALVMLGYTETDLRLEEGGSFQGKGSFEPGNVAASLEYNKATGISTGKGIALRLQPLTVKIEWRQEPQENIAVAFGSKAIDATIHGEKISIRDISISGNPSGKLKFAAGTVRYGIRRFPGPTGCLLFNTNRLEISARVPLPFKDAYADLNGYIDTTNWSNGELQGEVSRFTEENKHRLGSLFPGYNKYNILGSFAATFHWRLTDGVFVSPTVLDFENAVIENEDYEVAFHGVNQKGMNLASIIESIKSGSIHIARIASAGVGDLKVEKGEIRYEFLNSHTIFIHSMKWQWAGGELLAKDVTIDNKEDITRFELVVKNVRLQSFLDLFAKDRITGEGRLSGQLPITINHRLKQKIDIGSGFLRADPPKGWFKINDSEVLGKMMKSMPELDLKDPALSQNIRDRIELAMRDFAFTRLAIQFRELKGPGWTTHFRIQGKGRQGKRPQEFSGIDININGLDPWINAAIVITKKERELFYSAIDKSLDDIFGD